MQKYTSRNTSETKSIPYKTKWGIALLIISVALLFCLITNFLPFIRSIILGGIGLSAYPIILLVGIIGILMLSNKKYTIAKNYVWSLIGLYFVFICVLHSIFTDLSVASFSDYISNVFATKTTPGGVVAGAFIYGLALVVNKVGMYIVLGIIATICIAFIIDYRLKLLDYKKLNARAVSYAIPQKDNSITSQKIGSKRSLFKNKHFSENEQVKQETEKMNTFKQELVMTDGKREEDNSKIADMIFGDNSNTTEDNTEDTTSEEGFTLEQFINQARENSFANFNKNQGNNTNTSANKGYDYSFASNQDDDEEFVPQKPQPITSSINSQSMQGNFATELKLEPLEPIKPLNLADDDAETPSIDDFMSSINDNTFGQNLKPKQKEPKLEQLEMPQTKPTTSPTTVYKRPSPYVRPPLSLLTTQSSKQTENEADFRQNAEILEETLESFKISAVVESVVQGPAVTRYELKMPAGISVNKIKQHTDDIAMMMRSAGGVRIEAPIPGKNLVGIELPNKKIATIGLKDVLDSPDFTSSKSALPFALGKNISGSIKICDLASMPHLLVAGSTGSGKSVCLNIIIISLLYKMGPDDLKLILIDPKRVEFSSFNGLPHLCTPEAICQPKQALNAFDWAIGEMDNRFSTFQRLKVRNFEEYNSLEAVYKGKEPKLPRIVIIVDELADLMMFGKKELEDKIMRIAQLARAAGIHLVIATQRPSVDVITGTIKTNLPSRIAFSLNNYQDSMTIINQGGAEKLLGKGDMLYFPQNLPEPVRIQCPFLTNDEVKNIVDFVIKNNDSEIDMTLANQVLNGKGNNSNGSSGDDDGEGIEYDPILPKALFDFIKSGTASISAIQRRYAVGYARAARIVDQMESNGFISPADSTNKRKVLIDEERYNELFSDGSEIDNY